MKLDINQYNLPDDLEPYRVAVREFVRTDLEEITEEIERTKKLPEKVLPMLSEAGLLRLRLPRQYGGFGLTFSHYWPILLEVAQSSGAIRLLVHSMNTRWLIVHHHASEEQKRNIIPYWHQGKWTAGAITEPDAGTGLDLQTTATKVGDVWRINGTKHLITYADIAELVWVLCYTGDRSLGAKGMSVLIVPKGAPGMIIEPMRQSMGLWGSYHGIVHFRDCEIPVTNILGEEGHGLDIMLRTSLDPSRMSIGVCCLAIAERLLEHSAEFAKQRKTFGKPIADREGIRNHLADMATDIYAAKSMISDCSTRYDNGELIAAQSAMCKLYCLEMVGRVSDKALLIHGGVGYTKAHAVERLYRDARGMWFEEGTPSVHRLVISRDVLGQRVRSIGK